MHPNHHPSRTLTTTCTALALSALLYGCGGGGGGGSSSTPITPPVDNGSSLAVPDLGSVAVGTTTSTLPADWMHGAVMEIYVRGYKDSDGDGKGDLKGVISKLDYLQDLGVRGIWLMPVTDSADKDHGYAVKNYRAIETDYGSMADFDLLLTEAHKRGIGVIMDYVINHSAIEHPLFKNSASSATNPQRDYYVWQTSKPTGWKIYGADPWYAGGGGYYFAGFWSGMPDFNLRNSKVDDFHQDNIRFWLNKGVDGMRFDAVGNLVENGASAWEVQPENKTVMNRVQQLFKGYSQRYMVCEVPAASQAYATSDTCGSAFAFDLMNSIVGASKGQASSIQSLNQYFVTAPSTMAPIISNHDRFAGERLWNQLQGNTAQYKLAAASYLLLPGTPFIYYGEEIGISNANNLSGDHSIRTPMSWTADKTGFTSGTAFRALASNIATQNVASQVGVADSLHSFYKALLKVRNDLPSI
ncbi:MAG: alpha-amylase, partial [Rhodoferax sp.]|nr:alpha-amylase [Rhodoferax sp.]